MIDGHLGVLALSGNSSKDPLMNYTAAYWLDETKGLATKLAFVITDYPWEEGAGTMINTTHVEEISKPS